MNCTLVRFARFLVLATAAIMLPGCNAYVLSGKVVRGEVSDMQLVYENDPRMNQPGVAGAQVRATRDPDTLNRKLVGQSRSDAGGSFHVVMDDFGTGWMKEQWLLQAVAPGHQNAETLMTLPGKNSKWRLLITLAPGVSNPIEDEDLMKELEQFQ